MLVKEEELQIVTKYKKIATTNLFTYISQTPNATRNEAEFDRSKFSIRTKMTNFSQQQPINILKPLIFVCR